MVYFKCKKKYILLGLIADTPEVVVNLTGNQKKDVLQLSWDAARSLEADIMYYTIQVKPAPGYGTCATGVCNTTKTIFTITKLEYCVDYDITVQAVNCGGVGNATHWSIHYGEKSCMFVYIIIIVHAHQCFSEYNY